LHLVLPGVPRLFRPQDANDPAAWKAALLELSHPPGALASCRPIGVGRGLSASPSLRTVRADLPHTALQSVVRFHGLNLSLVPEQLDEGHLMVQHALGPDRGFDPCPTGSGLSVAF